MHWCWICGEGPIPSTEIGGHFAPDAGPCAGKQFEGIDPEAEFRRLLREAGGDMNALEPEQRQALMDHSQSQVSKWRNAVVLNLLLSIIYWWLLAQYVMYKDEYEQSTGIGKGWNIG